MIFEKNIKLLNNKKIDIKNYRIFFAKDKNLNNSKNHRKSKNIANFKSIKFKKYWPFSKIAGSFFVWYLIAILIGTFILAAPISLTSYGKGEFGATHNFSWDFLSSLFNATSGFSDTGLSVSNSSNVYNFFGQLVLIILIQMGGFGVLTAKVMFFIFIGRKISLKNKLLVRGERGNIYIGDTISLIKIGFFWLITIEIIGAVCLFPIFYFSKITDPSITFSPYHIYWSSFWSAIFHSVSAINNAGFDIIGNNSLTPYNHIYVIQFIFILEFVLGGIGFPTFYDISKKISASVKGEFSRLTLFTKLNLITYFLVSFIGLSLVFIIESIHPGGVYHSSSSGFNYFMNIFFNVMSTRNAGFSTVDLDQFQQSSKAVMSVMMFIGSAPSSTAGGIRTTTLSIIVLAIISVVRRTQVSAFKRKIPSKTVIQSFAVLGISFFLTFISTIIFLFVYPSQQLSDIAFLITSAFGTTGLSTFSINNLFVLSPTIKIIVILLMLIGQIGISNTLLMFKTKNRKEYKLIEENIFIG